MPKERTKEEGVPIGEKLKRMRPAALGGRKGDIRLPSENAGDRDPKLPPATGVERMRESMDVIRGLGKQSRRSDYRGQRGGRRV